MPRAQEGFPSNREKRADVGQGLESRPPLAEASKNHPRQVSVSELAEDPSLRDAGFRGLKHVTYDHGADTDPCVPKPSPLD